MKNRQEGDAPRVADGAEQAAVEEEREAMEPRPRMAASCRRDSMDTSAGTAAGGGHHAGGPCLEKEVLLCGEAPWAQELLADQQYLRSLLWARRSKRPPPPKGWYWTFGISARQLDRLAAQPCWRAELARLELAELWGGEALGHAVAQLAGGLLGAALGGPGAEAKQGLGIRGEVSGAEEDKAARSSVRRQSAAATPALIPGPSALTPGSADFPRWIEKMSMAAMRMRGACGEEGTGSGFKVQGPGRGQRLPAAAGGPSPAEGGGQPGELTPDEIRAAVREARALLAELAAEGYTGEEGGEG